MASASSGVDPVWWTPSQDLGSNSAAAALHQFENHRREDELHSDVQLSPWDHDGVGAAHEAQVDHREELGKIDALRIKEADGDHRFASVGIQRAMNGLDVSTVGARWKLMSV